MPKIKRNPISSQDSLDVDGDGILDPEKIREVVNAVHVVPVTQGWNIRRTGSGKNRVNRIYKTQTRAMAFAEKLAREHDVKLIIHDAPIQSRYFVASLPGKHQ
jgi:hypothetical protein